MVSCFICLRSDYSSRLHVSSMAAARALQQRERCGSQVSTPANANAAAESLWTASAFLSIMEDENQTLEQANRFYHSRAGLQVQCQARPPRGCGTVS